MLNSRYIAACLVLFWPCLAQADSGPAGSLVNVTTKDGTVTGDTTTCTPQLFDGGAYATQAFEQGYFGAPVFWTGRY